MIPLPRQGWFLIEFLKWYFSKYWQVQTMWVFAQKITYVTVWMKTILEFFDRPYWSKTLSSTLCTLGGMYNICCTWFYIDIKTLTCCVCDKSLLYIHMHVLNFYYLKFCGAHILYIYKCTGLCMAKIIIRYTSTK